MPTGYTADLHDGKDVTFPEFALQCARAFGALILLRDSPETPIPERFEPETYHRDALDRTRREIAEVEAWDDATATQRVNADHARAVAAYLQEADKRTAMRSRYELMLAQVETWVPPTAEHQGLKDFMVEQLKESIKFDCADLGDYWKPPQPITGSAFKAQELARLRRDEARHAEEYAADVERAEKRTAWVSALRDSLAGSLT